MKNKIVVIDDDKVTLKLIENALVKKDFNVRVASDGQKGFELIESEKPDFVISDILIANIDGFALAKKIRKSHSNKEMKIILISAVFKKRNCLADIKESGADQFFSKPLDIKELIAYLTKNRIEE